MLTTPNTPFLQAPDQHSTTRCLLWRGCMLSGKRPQRRNATRGSGQHSLLVWLKLMSIQPWTCHGLHESWQGRCRESFRIHGQPASADVGDSCYFLGSANVGQSRRCFSDISLNSKSRRKLDKYMRCNDWNIINETIRAQGLANAHI